MLATEQRPKRDVINPECCQWSVYFYIGWCAWYVLPWDPNGTSLQWAVSRHMGTHTYIKIFQNPHAICHLPLLSSSFMQLQDTFQLSCLRGWSANKKILCGFPDQQVWNFHICSVLVSPLPPPFLYSGYKTKGMTKGSRLMLSGDGLLVGMTLLLDVQE